MLPHHEAWLSAHPHRSKEWLAKQIADGFDVHHLDGEHDNNSPDNLVLIEHTDHMMIHGGRHLGRLTPSKKNKKVSAKYIAAKQRVDELRARLGMPGSEENPTSQVEYHQK